MRKYSALVFIVLLFACTVTGYKFIEESTLLEATKVTLKGSGYHTPHWFFTFENGMTMRNFDTGYSIGKKYKIYYSERAGKYKAVLKVKEKNGKDKV